MKNHMFREDMGPYRKPPGPLIDWSILLAVVLLGSFLGVSLGSSELFDPRQISVEVQARNKEVELAAIQSAIDRTQKTLDELEQKKKLYEQVLSADREQAEAIARMLSERQEEESRKESRRTLWINVGLSFVVNMVTVIIGLYLEYKVGFFRRWLTRR